MLLHAIDTGTGTGTGTAPPNRTALLLHGLMGSAESWWRVVPALETQGYRVLALDLPGHGLSPRDPALTIASAAASVVDTVRALAPTGPLHAIGHSFGATVLAAAAADLDPALAVFVDSALGFAGGHDRETLVAAYDADRRARADTAELRRRRPWYSARDVEVESRAAERFDPATAAALSVGADVALDPRPGDVIVRPDPSRWVSAADDARFRAAGAEVRTIPDAEHTVWYSHFAEFTACVPEMFARRASVH